jgi:arylsulfatase
VLEAAGLPQPTIVNGVAQAPIEGTSMLYSFNDADAPERHDLQYFEMFVNRGVYHEGWTAVTRHSTPWDPTSPLPAFDDDVWELYAPDDWTQARNIAADEPAKLAELQRQFLIEATKYNVLPLDDRRVERFNPDLAGRPQLIRGNTQVLFGGMGRLSENSVVVLKNKSHAITAQVEIPDGGASGVIVAQGGAFGGWSLYVHEGRPAYCYNLFGLQRFKVYGDESLAPGEHQVRLEFAYDGGGLGKGGDATLYVDGAQVAAGRVDATVPMVFSADETCDVGSDSGTPVSDDHDGHGSRFTGRVLWVQLDLGEDADDPDHQISEEERFRIAMNRQ